MPGKERIWRIRIDWIPALIVVFLVSCGGGGGGGATTPGFPSPEEPAIPGLPGPGDAGNHFPFAVGNTWHFQGTVTENGFAPVAFTNSISVIGTREEAGFSTMVFRETNPDNFGEPEAYYLAKEPGGIIHVGDPDFQMDSYLLARFPLETGDFFLQLNRLIDFGEDLDGDGITEKIQLHSMVTMRGFETVTVPAGTFEECAKLERSTKFTIIFSQGGSLTFAEEAAAWFAPDVGWVKRVSAFTSEDYSDTVEEELIGYSVDGEGSTVIDIGGPGEIILDQVAAGESRFYRATVSPDMPVNVSITGLTADADLFVYGDDATFTVPANCFPGQTQLIGNSLEHCTLTPPSPSLHIAVQGKSAITGFTFLVTPAPTITDPVDEGSRVAPIPVLSSLSHLGQVATRGESFYFAESVSHISLLGLTESLTDSAELRVFADETFSLELDCTLRVIGSRECALDNAGTAFFSVRAGPLNRDGAAYILLAR